MRKLAALLSVALVAIALSACGGGDDTTVTETVTEPTVTAQDTVTESTETQPTSPSGGTGPGPTGGETADLPLCSQGPPPCRTSGGGVVEP